MCSNCVYVCMYVCLYNRQSDLEEDDDNNNYSERRRRARYDQTDVQVDTGSNSNSSGCSSIEGVDGARSMTYRRFWTMTPLRRATQRYATSPRFCVVTVLPCLCVRVSVCRCSACSLAVPRPARRHAGAGHGRRGPHPSPPPSHTSRRIVSVTVAD